MILSASLAFLVKANACLHLHFRLTTALNYRLQLSTLTCGDRQLYPLLVVANTSLLAMTIAQEIFTCLSSNKNPKKSDAFIVRISRSVPLPLVD